MSGSLTPIYDGMMEDAQLYGHFPPPDYDPQRPDIRRARIRAEAYIGGFLRSAHAPGARPFTPYEPFFIPPRLPPAEDEEDGDW